MIARNLYGLVRIRETIPGNPVGTMTKARLETKF